MTLEEIDPELFLYELYNANGLHELDVALCIGTRIGWCDASRLQVRPKSGEVAIMMEFEDGNKFWCHADRRMLELIRKRIERKEN